MADESLQGVQEANGNRGLDFLLVAFALAVEALAVIFGWNLLAIGSAVMIWFAIRAYTKRLRSGKSLIWNLTAGLLMGSILLIGMTQLIALKRYMEARSAVTASTQTGGTQLSTPQTNASTASAASAEQPQHKSKPRPKATSKKATSKEDNSVHIEKGVTLDQSSTGLCSPNIIGGHNTVNCDTKPEPTMSFVREEQRKADTQGKVWTLWYFKLDHPMFDPAFEVKCDRPCVTNGIVVTGNNVDCPFYRPDEPNISGIVVKSPSPLPSGIELLLQLYSKDDKPVHVIGVSRKYGEDMSHLPCEHPSSYLVMSENSN